MGTKQYHSKRNPRKTRPLRVSWPLLPRRRERRRLRERKAMLPEVPGSTAPSGQHTIITPSSSPSAPHPCLWRGVFKYCTFVYVFWNRRPTRAMFLKLACQPATPPCLHCYRFPRPSRPACMTDARRRMAEQQVGRDWDEKKKKKKNPGAQPSQDACGWGHERASRSRHKKKTRAVVADGPGTGW